jgi:ribose transport system ATP-binding protein
MGEMLIRVQGINKAFPGVQALLNAKLELKAGEVHALMGENGAGKSTLMKILTGIYQKDSGVILFEGKEVDFNTPKDAQDAGIAIVHQELYMMNHLTVAQNLFIGKENMTGMFINDRSNNEQAKELFSKINININPKEIMGNLTVGKQQMVEIAKAISTDAKVIIFDEPTSALTDVEIEELFKIIKELKSRGIGIIYITHRMDEIEKITDRVTVMRDGEYVGTLDTTNSCKNNIISMMVGRVIYEDPKEKSNVAPNAPVVLTVKNLKAGKLVKDVSFELRKGEILGFAGLMGSGRTETARALFGADKKDSGQIFLKGEEINIESPMDAVKYGIGYLSEDRKRYGIIVEKSVADNSVMACLENYTKGIFVNDTKIKKDALDYVERLKTKTPSVEQYVKNLSGGNQQKVVIAKWLLRDCDILIFDEPTRGIDVGAKSEIYSLINELASQGKSIIMISSDLTEIFRMSDRVIVMCEGKKTGDLKIEEATQEKIMYAATYRDK